MQSPLTFWMTMLATVMPFTPSAQMPCWSCPLFPAALVA
jgi:hypothetical protein